MMVLGALAVPAFGSTLLRFLNGCLMRAEVLFFPDDHLAAAVRQGLQSFKMLVVALHAAFGVNAFFHRVLLLTVIHVEYMLIRVISDETGVAAQTTWCGGDDTNVNQPHHHTTNYVLDERAAAFRLLS